MTPRLLRASVSTSSKVGELVLQKSTDQCTIDGQDIKLHLTQEETALFDSTKHVRIQLHILTLDDEAMISDVYSVYVGECLGGEVIE